MSRCFIFEMLHIATLLIYFYPNPKHPVIRCPILILLLNQPYFGPVSPTLSKVLTTQPLKYQASRGVLYIFGVLNGNILFFCWWFPVIRLKPASKSTYSGRKQEFRGLFIWLTKFATSQGHFF